MARVTQLRLIRPQVVVEFESALLEGRVKMIILALLSLGSLLYALVDLSDLVLKKLLCRLCQGVCVCRLVSA